jgi:RHS repeat-associated protein
MRRELENPASQGTFHYNLRFPGQYYDAEIGTNYNYYRDYDPTIGRYVESDPIGLAGGMDTYGYGLQDPISHVDPLGLQTADIPERPRIPGFPNPIDVFIPGTPANDAFVNTTLTILNKIAQACTPDPCDDAKREAARRYENLMKDFQTYMSGGTRGPDKGHRKAIIQEQAALQDSIRKVGLYCKPPPPELEEWKRAASMPVPILY